MGSFVDTGFVVDDAEGESLTRVSDIEVFETSEGTFMAVASEARGSVSTYALTPGEDPSLISTVELSDNSGTNTVSDMVMVENGNGYQLMTLGRYDDNYGLYTVAEDGSLTLSKPLTEADGDYDQGLVGDAVYLENNGRTLFYTANFATDGVQVTLLTPSGDTRVVQSFSDNQWLRLGDVTAIHQAELHGQEMLFTGSAFDAGVHSFSTFGSGLVSRKDREIPKGEDTEGFAGITDIESVMIEDRGFIIVAGALSGTMTVMRVSKGYDLRTIDREEDTLNTRFDGVTDIETFQTDDRTFVIAGGADDGVSLYEMTYRGKLVHLETVKDEFDTTLGDVSAIDVYLVGETAHVLVGSASDHGITELVFDLSRSGEEIRGDAVEETIIGTAGDDLIWGMGRKDTLDGGAGDDRLIDGRGKDTLIGGPGADIFEFTKDGRTDFILDFEFGIDKIDLTEFDSTNSFESLTIGSRLLGAAIIVEDEVIRLRNPDGTPYDVSSLGPDDFIFG